MRAVMMLADYAVVADGKLTIVGGGWSTAGPAPVAFAIAGKLEVPWDQTNMQHKAVIELIDADGQPVLVPTEDGEQPFRLELGFEVGRPPGVRPGTPLDFPFAINLPPQPFPPGARYEFQLTIDGQTDADWRLAFTMRAAEA